MRSSTSDDSSISLHNMQALTSCRRAIPSLAYVPAPTASELAASCSHTLQWFRLACIWLGAPKASSCKLGGPRTMLSSTSDDSQISLHNMQALTFCRRAYGLLAYVPAPKCEIPKAAICSKTLQGTPVELAHIWVKTCLLATGSRSFV